jgi:precorrin-6A/cobalt-precorrin-6A reductase
MRLLILGGTSEAGALAAGLAARPDIAPILSLAGRTAAPRPAPIAMRVGGFGGIAGLADYLATARIDAVVDATHPFAAQMSRHALAACTQTGVPLLRLTRAAWQAEAGDRWIEVADMAGAAAALGGRRRRVFLTVGSLSLPAFAAAPWHHYVIRSIDPPRTLAGLPDHTLLLARGPFRQAAEAELMRAHRIDILVTKNSGGGAAAGKLAAARSLDLPVVIVARPPAIGGQEVDTVDAVLDWLDRHRPGPAPRGV